MTKCSTWPKLPSFKTRDSERNPPYSPRHKQLDVICRNIHQRPSNVHIFMKCIASRPNSRLPDQQQFSLPWNCISLSPVVQKVAQGVRLSQKTFVVVWWELLASWKPAQLPVLPAIRYRWVGLQLILISMLYTCRALLLCSSRSASR